MKSSLECAFYEFSGKHFQDELLNLPALHMKEYPNNRRRSQPPALRAMLDYFMAIVWIFFGCIILFPVQILGVDYFANSALVNGGMKWILGILFILYGFFRAYRGYIASKRDRSDDA